VKIAEGKQGSIFDQLEDLDTQDCLEKVSSLAHLNEMNSAFVFIKPHAVTDKVKDLAKQGLEARGIRILTEGSLTGEVIDERKLIDQHYYSIASKATLLQPHELNVPADKFEKQFGLTWADALAAGKVYNAMDGCKKLEIDADQLNTAWAVCKKDNKLVKFGRGFYCGLVEIEGKESIYIFNGFFMSMRSKFTAPGTEIYYFVVQWDPATLSWSDFRNEVLGPTDPVTAPADSLRGQILGKWEELGLKEIPNVGDNGMHASASPFEALAERCNWLSVPVAEDPFGRKLMDAGMTEAAFKAWSVDPQVKIDAESKMGSIFDQLEDQDSEECFRTIVKLGNLNEMTLA